MHTVLAALESTHLLYIEIRISENQRFKSQSVLVLFVTRGSYVGGALRHDEGTEVWHGGQGDLIEMRTFIQFKGLFSHLSHPEPNLQYFLQFVSAIPREPGWSEGPQDVLFFTANSAVN